LFVGEDEPGAGARLQTVHRLRHGISPIDLSHQAVLVVYEPAWAIGADRAADAEYVGETVADLKDLLRRLGASDPEVLYGGTVKKDNIEQFAALDVLDGVGATRASLDAHGLMAMIDRMTSSG
ncbi:MAG: triose-phosphate isomerase, partial [Actinobacteria bacterium]|nr:triose-phosphate isomerase [Actinomycetota bacterium]